MLETLKNSLWKQFGASIDMLENAILLCPEDYWNNHKRLFYSAFHTILFLDYYLTIPPTGFSSRLPFTNTSPNDLPADAIDDLVPNKMYSKNELLDYLQASRDRCHRLIKNLTESRLTEKWMAVPDEIAGGGVMDFSVLDILLFNMRHVQHHAAQLNLLLRQGINNAPNWVSQSAEAF